VLYNHPVLTFALGRVYIPLRSEVLVLNERYARPSGPAGAPPGGGLAGGQLPPTPMATWTPSPTPTPTGSPTPTSTPTVTPTPTDEPLCYTLGRSVSPSDAGNIDVSPGPNCSGGRYTAGTRVHLSASPECKEGFWGWCWTYWTFDHWSGDASGGSPGVSITMDGPKSVTAHFR